MKPSHRHPTSRIFLALALLLAPAMLPAQTADAARLRSILGQYLDAMGGEFALQRIESMRIAATSTDAQGNSTSIVVIKKRPLFVRISIESGNLRIIQGVDGKAPWQWVTGPGIDSLIRLPDAVANSLLRDAAIGSLLLHASTEHVRVSYAGEGTLALNPCHIIRADFAGGGHALYYIDARTFLELQIVEHPPADSGEPPVVLIPGDYRRIAGVLIAFRTTRRVNDVVVNTTTIDDVTVNSGVLELVFSPPRPLP
jgi:hypothetical protein